MRYRIWLIIFLFICTYTQAQVERIDLAANKILSITKTVIVDRDTLKKEVFKNYYSVNGDDSAEYYNDIRSFTYMAQKDEDGRVVQLIRYDIKGNPDEWHKYKYNKDGSYNIEKIAQGAGTINLSYYDKRNWLMEEEIESSYSMIYQRNKNGRTQKILVREKGSKDTEVIAQFYFDKKGLVTKGEGTTEGGSTVFFKYNNKNLPIEIKTIYGDKKEKQKIEIMYLEYAYYEN